MNSYWYLEHVSSGKKAMLQIGENTLGRHSSCKPILKDYEFLSRNHAKITVTFENGVLLEQMGALNGIFINNVKLIEESCSLNCGDHIGLGVEIDKRKPEVPETYAIFELKQSHTPPEEVILISDDEEDNENVGAANANANANAEIPEPEALENKDGILEEQQEAEMENRAIHLPKLPDVKKELLSQASREIENIFGEPDEELLESVFQINPYIYNQLNNNNCNIPATCNKICNGDIIELQEELPPRPINIPVPFKLDFDFDGDDYDENFAMSQAVLKEMKEEMADVLADLSDLEFDTLENDDLMSTTSSPINTSVATQIDEDEIIIIEDDDDELLSKVADWSSKLFSQNVMSQIYPLEDKGRSPVESDSDSQNLQTFNNDQQPRHSKALRIESSGSEEENAQPCNQAEKSSSEEHTIRRCTVRLQSIDVPQVQETPEASKESSPVVDYSSDPLANINQILEVVLVPQVPKPKAKPKPRSSKSRKKTPKKNETDKPNQKTQTAAQKTKKPTKPPDVAPVAQPKTETKQSTTCSNRLRNRSKSCYVELSEEESVDPRSSTTKKTEHKSNSKKATTKTINAEKSEKSEPPKAADTNKSKRSKASPIAETKSPTVSQSILEAKATTARRSRSKTISERSEISTEKSKDTTKSKESKDKPLESGTKSSSRSSSTSSSQNKTQLRKRSKTISERSQLCDDTGESPETTDKTKSNNKLKDKPKEIITPIAEKKSPVSARLLNRSKSCLLDRPESTTVSTKNTETSRKPILVEPPNLPVHRGKLRGVSAENREKANIDAILEKQRSLNYQAEMKRKWYQKPTDKKKEYEQNKKLRREQLQKLTEKPKSSNDSTSNSNGLKRKHTNIPTLSNCNRGEFLTKEMEQPEAKKRKLNRVEEKGREREKVSLKRRATIECFSDQRNVNETVKSPPFHYSRPPERKEAEVARNQRTCNRVTFADMDREFKSSKRNRRVRFNDVLQIKIIERVDGANRKVENLKDSKKFSLSRYAERREWAQAKGKLENHNDLITGNILSWGNQWLLLRSADDVADSDVLLPIPSEFKSYKQYKETIIPLMKVELLTTIERDYKSAKTTFDVSLLSYNWDDNRDRPRYLLVTRYNDKPKKFDLYTLCSGDKMKETFATLSRMLRIAGNVYELTFEVLQKDVNKEKLQSVKSLTVRPVVDNMRVEMGAFNAVYQLGHSPLFHRILKPSENVITFDSKVLKDTRYRGFSRLNKQQMDICQNTWIRLIDDSTPSITLIQGPPGTGKSAVISNLTLQCMYGSTSHTLDRKILICAHSNAAVDNITLSLNHARKCMSHSQFELLRFGFLEKMDSKVRELSLDYHLGHERTEKMNRLSAENIDSLIQQQLELKMEIADLKQRSAPVSYVQQHLQAKEQQLRLVNDKLNPPLTPREEYELSKKYIKQANIVCTTLSSCVKLAQFIDYFDACIIDEATQCTEPWTLLPLQFGVRGLVLVGDTQQLPATVLSQKAIKFGLGNSMFDRIQRNLKQQLNKERINHFGHTQVFKLSRQYRMHPEICKWPNSYFYENELVNAENTKGLKSPIIPYCVINLSFTRDTNDTNSRSISNDEEARFVSKLLVEMDKYMPAQRYRYGLITPYSNQCSALSKVIPSHMMITPQTVDAYQGQERDVIILSNARTRGVGFLTNYQRLNVAITRPRRCLIICGNFDDLQAVDMWRHLLDDARKRKIYFDLNRSDVHDLNRSLINKILVKPV